MSSGNSPHNNDGNQAQLIQGMLLMIVAMLALPVMDGIAKLLATSYDVSAGQVTFGRFTIQSLILLPFIVVLKGVAALRPKHLWINLLRGALMGLAVLLFFTTVKYMPIADAIAVFFIEPFILTILSVIFLKETVGWRRALAVLVGFGGAMLVVQPSYEVFGAVSLLPIGTAILFATYLLLTRIYAGDDDPLTMQFVSGVGGTLMLAAILITGTWMGVEDIAAPKIPEFGIRWVLIFSIGILATVGHLMVVYAFRLASASILAPFQYVEIIGATIVGYVLFDDFPEGIKWVGIFIIVGSGIYLFMRGKNNT